MRGTVISIGTESQIMMYFSCKIKHKLKPQGPRCHVARVDKAQEPTTVRRPKYVTQYCHWYTN